ncbi:MAG: hypothetical protein KF832_29680, partial [Caldilineaceae bacterium]|nr:hypothetical protein [Caldilineaceae bacterium]
MIIRFFCKSKSAQWRTLRKVLHGCVVAALLAGLLPPPLFSDAARLLVGATLPPTLAEPVVEAAAAIADLLPAVPAAQAAAEAAPIQAPFAAPLVQLVGGTQVLTVTKTISGTGSGPFDITIEGPNNYSTTAQIDGGEVLTFSVPTQGVYTVTENTPVGWTTVYTATPGTGGSTNAVVTLANANTATLASLPITGTVFRDFNSDGAITANGVITDTGMPSVTVTAYDKNGNAVGSAVTDADGNYTINPSGAGPYRIEFSDLPAGYEPTSAGADNGTSTQFVTTAGEATNVNLGINQPCDYCQADPSVMTSKLNNGSASHVSNNNQVAVYRYPYAISGAPPSNVITGTYVQDVGSVWGLAYNRTEQTVYHSALLRRHVGLGPDGIGAIYQQADAADPSSVSLFYDFGGTTPNDATRFPGTGTSFGQEGPCRRCDNIDPTVFSSVGKAGLGDITMSLDDQTLYVSNLADRNIYAINTVGTPTAQALGTPPWLAAGFCGANPDTSPTGVGRPWAVKAYADGVYAGVTCDASTSTTCSATGACADLTAYVYQWDGASWSSVLSTPIVLNHQRDFWRHNGGSEFWHPWTDDYAVMKPYVDMENGSVSGADEASYPQPILMQIEVDVDGALILGFGDRTAYQLGFESPAPDAGSAGDIDNNYTSAGELLRVAYNSGTYTLENNGIAPPLVGTGTNGPGGNAFYDTEWLISAALRAIINTPSYPYDADLGLGGLAFLPGSQETLFVSSDPWYSYSSGVAFYSNLNGSPRRAATLYDNSPGGNFVKAGGLGDAILLCDPAPIEVGNRVWDDLNGNGIQDPGEPGLSGLTVSLQGPTGTVNTTTDSDGLYYFGNLQPNSAYTLTMNVPAGYDLATPNAAALSGASVTSNHPISDTRDSDASLVGAVATIYYTTGSAGQNNHGLDFGFTPPVGGLVEILNIAPIPVPDPGGYTISKAITTTDGSTPSVSGTFDVVVNCIGAAGYPTTLSLNANGTPLTVGNLMTGTLCTFTEVTLDLPAAPSGYTWINAQVSPASLVIQSNVTTTVTATNWLAPVPETSTVLTVTKTISGTGSGPFDITIEGPNNYSTTAQIDGGEVLTFSVPTQGVYTVTENTPAGWTTVYTATPGTGGSTNAVVTLANANTATLASLPITGTVFRDFNSDGAITANGVITDIGMPGVTVTAYDKNGNAVGSAVTAADGTYTINPSGAGPYRIEFSDLPSGYEPTSAGADNGTSTQFVTTAGEATNVNLGINYPADYCQDNPALCSNVYVNGDASTTAPTEALVQFAYDSSGLTPAPTTIATKAEIGSAWGLAYNRRDGIIYNAAFLKRHTGLGPDGLGAIYAVDPIANTSSLWVDLVALGIDVGQAGVPTNAARGLGSPLAASTDPAVFPLIGKVGIGGIALSDDYSTLYAMSLNDQTLYAIDVAAGVVAGTYPVPNPGCTGGNWRPFATTYSRNGLYVGGVCDAETSQSAADLRAVVYRFDGSTFTNILDFALTYPKGIAFNECASNTGWFPWTTVVPPDCNGIGARTYPTPLLTDIAVDVDGSLILGFVDRTGHQLGWHNGTLTDASAEVAGMAGGDILRAYNNNGTFVLENNATAGPNTTSGANNGQGPGNGEYYFQEHFAPYHRETSHGGLALLPGSGEVTVTSMDPFNLSVDSGGINWFNNRTGLARNPGYRLYFSADDSTFGKAAGIGDVELLCDEAPLEIGNRVWDDLNGNGIQDPGEPGLSGLQVSLQGPTGTVNTTTDSDGLYYFTNLQTNSAYTLTMNVPGGYALTMPNAEALSGASVSSNHAISDTRDSDAVLIGGLATIYYTTGSAGQNNHGLDFGFTEPVDGLAEILNIAPPPVPGGFSISKAITTTDGSLPSVSGTFDVVVSCLGAAGYPTTVPLDANGTPLSAGGLVTGTRCSFVEDTVNLPAAPSGYTWVNAQISPAAIVIQDNVTATVTATNWLAPLPEPATQVLTVTKTISGTGSGPFDITITGPNNYSTTAQIDGGEVLTFSVPTQGVYTVTESTPAGWTTVYTATPGTSGSTNAVVTLGNANTATLASLPISGMVFRDFNSDGAITANGLITDTGMPGVTVTAYDKAGNSVGSAVTAANGAYTLNPTGDGPYRIEFSDLPAGYEPTSAGADNGTSTQFVITAGDATNVNLGVNIPADYCQNNPDMCVPLMINNDPGQGTPNNTLLRFPYQYRGTAPTITNLAEKAEIGSTWGVAYNRQNGSLYTAAFLKRHVGLGPNGLGAIYEIPNANSSAGTPTLLIDLATVAGVDVGTIGDNTTRGLTGAPSAPNADPTAFPLVGKIGLGDIDISDDSQTLYTVNLNQRTLLRIPIAAPTTLTAHAIPTDYCADPDDTRPFATKYYQGKVYVGVTCDGTSTSDRDDLAAVIYEFDPTLASFTNVLEIPLDYQKGQAAPSCLNTTIATQWNVWTDIAAPLIGPQTSCIVGLLAYPQPLLTDIEFDMDGSMLIGFADRWGHQVGHLNLFPNGVAGESGVTSGDLLRAYNNNGVFELESNGAVGPLTSSGVNNNEGPGNGEFYNGDYQVVDVISPHHEIGNGGLAFLRGTNEVASTALDAAGIAYTGGVRYFNNTNGSGSAATSVQLFNSAATIGLFAKSHGLGDIELLCDEAPIEIGNRVWDDL